MFFGTSISKVFYEVLGGFWEAKILNFRIFFDVFSMSFFKHDSEGPKIDPRAEQETESALRKLGSGDPQAPGERKG